MRDVLETPRQFALEFESVGENGGVTLTAKVEGQSNVVSVNFCQHRSSKLRATDGKEKDRILEHVLSNARKLSW